MLQSLLPPSLRQSHARFYDPILARFTSPDTLDPNLPGVGTTDMRMPEIIR